MPDFGGKRKGNGSFWRVSGGVFKEKGGVGFWFSSGKINFKYILNILIYI